MTSDLLTTEETCVSLSLPHPANYETPSAPFSNRSDPEWATYLHWSAFATPLPPSTSPLLEPTNFLQDHNSHSETDSDDSMQFLGAITNSWPDLNALKIPLIDSPAPLFAEPAIPSTKKDRIPRPPNAFMLFRSSLLKRGYIPAGTERRQQNLSCIAGEIWRMLSSVEKSKWQEKAAQKLREHQERYPNYKFQPRGRSRKDKDKEEGEDTSVRRGSEWIREIREKYTPFIGPAHPRKKKKKSPSPAKRARPVRKGRSELLTSAPTPRFVADPIVLPILPAISPFSAPIELQRRPSTSLGFAALKDVGISPSLRPSSAPLEEIPVGPVLPDFNQFGQLPIFDGIPNIPSAPSSPQSSLCLTPQSQHDFLLPLGLSMTMPPPCYQSNELFPPHLVPGSSPDTQYDFEFGDLLGAAPLILIGNQL